MLPNDGLMMLPNDGLMMLLYDGDGHGEGIGVHLCVHRT
jgi:hypothetical protein